MLGARASSIPFVEGSLTDRLLLQKTCDEQCVTHLIHLAALLTPKCQQDPWAGCEVNVMGSMSLFELARARKDQIRGFSYASSLAVYGSEADDPQLSGQTADNRPPHLYGAFKKAVEMFAEQYWRHFGIASTGIRPHVVYGPERDQGLTAGPSLAMCAAVRGERYTIGYTGRVGYDYVEDVARAFVQAALETPRGSHVVDLPSQQATTEEFVAAILQIVPGAAGHLSVDGPAIPTNTAPRPCLISSVFPDWRSTSLVEGVRRTVQFYLDSKTADT